MEEIDASRAEEEDLGSEECDGDAESSDLGSDGDETSASKPAHPVADMPDEESPEDLQGAQVNSTPVPGSFTSRPRPSLLRHCLGRPSTLPTLDAGALPAASSSILPIPTAPFSEPKHEIGPVSSQDQPRGHFAVSSDPGSSRGVIVCPGASGFESDPPFVPTIDIEEPKPALPSLLKISHTRNGLTYARDNIAHFISADCELTTPVSKLLQALKFISRTDIKAENPCVGQVFVTPIGKHRVFTVFIKKHHFDRVTPEMTVFALQNLQIALDKYHVKTLRMADGGDETGGNIKDYVARVFDCLPISVCLTQGKIEVPPEGNRKEIIKESHSSLMGGHKGVVKTYQRIRQRYYWPGMKEQIYKFILACTPCQTDKLTRIKTRQPMIITDTPFQPFEKISMDTVGPLEMTPDENMHILTIQDNFSKFCCAIPLPDIRTQTIAEALISNFISLYGCPRVILSDRGTSFTSKLLAKLARILRIKRVLTSAYHPQSNGALERSHHSLVEYLRVFVTSYHDWDRFLPMAMFNYNTSVHSATKFTPFELLYGQVARAPTALPDFSEIHTYPEALESLITRLSEARTIARENLVSAKLKSKERFDKSLHELKLAKGDFAYILKEPRKGKLDRYYNGPFEVVDITEQGNIVFETEEGKRFVRHPDKVKKRPPAEVEAER